MSEAKLRTQLAASLELHSKEGLITYNGHVSVRIPGSDRMLVSPYGGGLTVSAEDMVVLDLSGRVIALGPSKLPPPSESAIHRAIYRARPDVMAIAHTHPPVSTYFGIADAPIVPVHVSGAVFGDSIPVLDDPDLVKTDTQGDILAKTLGSSRALLIRGHGAVTVGESVEAAFLASLYLEENCRHQLFASLLGKPRPFTTDETARVLKATWGEDGARLAQKVWSFYLTKWGLSPSPSSPPASLREAKRGGARVRGSRRRTHRSKARRTKR
jgi:L-fuculose-phosphate aldolase